MQTIRPLLLMEMGTRRVKMGKAHIRQPPTSTYSACVPVKTSKSVERQVWWWLFCIVQDLCLHAALQPEQLCRKTPDSSSTASAMS